MVEGSVDEGGGSVEDAGESDSGPEDPPEAGSLLIQEELEVCFPSSAISETRCKVSYVDHFTMHRLDYY